MAESKIPKHAGERHAAYVGSGTYTNDIGSTITCSFDLRRFSNIQMMVFANSIGSANRRLINIPNWYGNQNAAYYLYATPTGYGSIRLETNNNTITLVSCTEPSLYVSAVYVLD